MVRYFMSNPYLKVQTQLFQLLHGNLAEESIFMESSKPVRIHGHTFTVHYIMRMGNCSSGDKPTEVEFLMVLQVAQC